MKTVLKIILGFLFISRHHHSTILEKNCKTTKFEVTEQYGVRPGGGAFEVKSPYLVTLSVPHLSAIKLWTQKLHEITCIPSLHQRKTLWHSQVFMVENGIKILVPKRTWNIPIILFDYRVICSKLIVLWSRLKKKLKDYG